MRCIVKSRYASLQSARSKKGSNSLTHKTHLLSSFEKYLSSADDSLEARAGETRERESLLRYFPHPVMLEMAFPELDNASRWCWKHLGAMDGECTQKQSEYRICSIEGPHRHAGKWTSHWFVKTDYDFGYNEFYFIERADRDLFLEQLAELDWGEHYSK